MAYIGNRPVSGDNNSFRVLDDIKTHTFSFDGSSSSVVSTSDNTITHKGHRLIQGQRVTYTDGTGSAIGGLTDGTVYFVVMNDANSFKLASSASNASAGTGINLSSVGSGTDHTITVAFDGVNTKFKATYNNGTEAEVTRVAQIQISLNNVIQQPQNTATPTSGFGFESDSVIVFAAAPASNATFWGVLFANNFPTFEISDNDVDNFTGNGSTTEFSLSKSPATNENIIVTIDGVVQYPSDNSTTRAYNTVGNALQFSAAPANGADIQARHIGFAGPDPSVAGVTAFYGRTGSVFLTNSDSIVVNNAEVAGNLTVQGDTTTLNTTLRNVELLRVDGDDTVAAGIITQRGSGDILKLYDTSSPVFVVKDGGKVGIGTDNPHVELDIEGETARIHLHDRDGNLAQILQSGNALYLNLDAEGNGNGSFRIRSGGNSSEQEVLRIGNAGNVGIGTATVDAKLHVEGDIKASGNADIGSLAVSGISTFQNKVHLLDNDVLNLGGSLGEVGDLLIFANGTTNAIDARNSPLTIRNNVSNTGGGYTHNIQIQAKTGENSAIFNPEGSVDLYYDNVKRLATSGVGATISDSAASGSGISNSLDLLNNGNNSGDGSSISFLRSPGTTRAQIIAVKNETANNETDILFKTTKSGGTLVETLRIEGSTQSVGIGTTNPGAPLHVHKVNGTIAIFGDSGTDNATFERIAIKNNVTGYPAISNDSSNDTLDLRSMGSIQATIDSNGNSTGKYFRVTTNGEGSSGTELFRVGDDGEVRIADGGLLTINTNVASTYGVQEALRIDDNNSINDRAFQIFEYENSGGRWFSLNQNLNVTTTGTSYTYTQGNYGGSNMIEMTNGDLRIYNNPSIVSAGTSAITPTETVTILNNGRVGIATNNPHEKLHITDAGNPKILIEDTESSNQVGVRFKTTTQDWIAGLHGGISSFKISKHTGFGVNDYFTINGAGKVGINTDNPSQMLTVRGTILKTRSDSGLGLIYLQNDASNNGQIVINQNGGVTRVKLDSAGDSYFNGGYLALGHTSPDTRLDVKQNNGVAYNGNVQNVAYNAARFFNESGHTTGGTYTGLQFSITGDSQDRICSIGMISEASNSKLSSLVFHTDDNSTRTEKVRIDSSGNMQVSTGQFTVGTTASTGLQFINDGTFGTLHSANLTFRTASSPKMTLDTSGNLGIGTDDPNHELTIYGDEPNIRLTHTGSTNKFNALYTRVDGTGVEWNSYQDGTGTRRPFIFKQYTTEVLRITSEGTLFSKSPSDATPNFKWRSDDVNWHGYLNQTVHGATISTILSCGGTWTVDGTTYNATKDYNGSFGTAALIVHNQYNNTATGGELVFVTKANGSSTTDGAVSERFRINSSGKVGIGTDLTTTPSSTLTVSPHTNGGRNISIYTSGAVGNKAGLFFNATSGTGNLAEIQAEYKGTNSGDLIFNTSMEERLRITSDGHTIPGENVTNDLGANVNNRWRNIYGQTLSLTSYATIGSIVASDPGSAYYAYNNRIGSGLAIVGTTRMFGSVGINEASPVAKLHIKGSGNAPCLVLPDDTNTRYSVGFGNTNVSGVGQRLDFYAGDSGNNSNNLTSAHRRMSLTSQGRLGIGTDSPADILDINSDQASAVSDVYIRNHANLGGAALNLFTQGTYSSPTYKAIIGCSDAGGTIRMGAASNHPLLLLVNNSPMVHIDTSGRVLIGTQTQNNNARLQVTTTNQVVATFEGTGVSDPQIYVGDNMASPTDNCIILGYDKADNRGYLTVGGDGDDVFTVTNGGNIGIGIADPSTKLDISGGAIQLRNGNELKLLNAANSASTKIFCDGGARIHLQSYNQSVATFEEGVGVTFFSGSGTPRFSVGSTGLTTLKNFNGTGLRLEGSGGDYQGIQLKVTDASASQTRNVFIDAVNESGNAVANMVGAVQADGGSKWEWQTQAVGNDRNDRRVTRVNINPDGEVGINSVSADGSTAVTNGTSVIKFGGFGDSAIPPNAVGGVTVQVFTDTITGDIKIPRNGCIMAVTSFTDNDGTTFPQPSGAGLIYVDVGNSKNLEIMTSNNVSGSLRVRDSRKTGINDLDDDGNDFFVDNKVTFMPGTTNGTIQIANRWDTSPTSTRIMFYLTFL